MQSHVWWEHVTIWCMTNDFQKNWYSVVNLHSSICLMYPQGRMVNISSQWFSRMISVIKFNLANISANIFKIPPSLRYYSAELLFNNDRLKSSFKSWSTLKCQNKTFRRRQCVHFLRLFSWNFRFPFQWKYNGNVKPSETSNCRLMRYLVKCRQLDFSRARIIY